jgi:hypothetical protein
MQPGRDIKKGFNARIFSVYMDYWSAGVLAIKILKRVIFFKTITPLLHHSNNPIDAKL